MSIEVDNLITRNIEQLRDPIKIELLIKKIKDFENDKHLVKEKYISLINDSPVKTELEADQRRYFSDETFDSYMERRIQFNLERFYHNYIFYAITFFGVCKDIELLEAIEKYLFRIIYESIEEKLGYDWNFVLDSTIRFESTVKYEIAAYKEIFSKLDDYLAQKRILEILERVRNYNTVGYHNKDIYKDTLLEEFLSGYYDILQKRIDLKQKDKKPKKEVKSFRLLQSGKNVPKLDKVHKMLIDNVIIEDIGLRDFKKIFLGVGITKPINFIGDGARLNLSYFIYLLRFEQKILLPENNVNQQIIYCFRENRKLINPGSLEQDNIRAKDFLPKNKCHKRYLIKQILDSIDW